MSYTKQVWQDLPSTNTPITANRLNHMEDGIETVNTLEDNLNTLENNLNTSIGDLTELETTEKTNLVGAINEVVSNIDNLVTTSNNYIKIGNVGMCWGQINPGYANANVLQGSTSLPLSFINGKCIATPVNYANAGFELDVIAKVPLYVNGNGITLALHSKSASFTTGSTAFYINYIVVGRVN